MTASLWVRWWRANSRERSLDSVREIFHPDVRALVLVLFGRQIIGEIMEGAIKA
ncbi:hypothetical protein ACLQ26_13120 [Micromonospora sp. DT43]|uniref:hypothetical protein n=1 Tax=Micromonospora sp. DT43 TaxID=3393440 RepID=UPI003CF7BBA8